MRRTLTTLAILSAAAVPAYADDSRLVTSATMADIQALIVEEGHTIISTGDDGAVSVRARTSEGLIFNILGTACDTEYAEGCLGINMQVRYDADGEETLERINEVNLMWAATSAWYSVGGVDGNTPTVGITRYVILDRGITAGNLKDNLLNLLAIAPRRPTISGRQASMRPDISPMKMTSTTTGRPAPAGVTAPRQSC